jgi:hypothetical protein
LRFWEAETRGFSIQLQLVGAPDIPGPQAAGGLAQAGRHDPGQPVRLTPSNWANHASPATTFAFRIHPQTLYNARLTVSESISQSDFLQFWAGVLSNEAVRTQAASDLASEILVERQAQAAADAYLAARSTLVGLVATCTPEGSDAAILRDREALRRAAAGFNDAARDASRAGLQAAFPADGRGLGEVRQWCLSAAAHRPARDRQLIAAQTAVRCRAASAPHRSGGRGCTGRSGAWLPSGGAGRSSRRR